VCTETAEEEEALSDDNQCRMAWSPCCFAEMQQQQQQQGGPRPGMMDR